MFEIDKQKHGKHTTETTQDGTTARVRLDELTMEEIMLGATVRRVQIVLDCPDGSTCVIDMEPI